MSLTFLAPLFLLGLLAVAVPIIVHLVNRERRNAIAFPSLMFLRRVPFRSVRRQRIRHWPLFALRCLALALLALAFARPFLDRESSERGRRRRGTARARRAARPLVQHGIRRSLVARDSGGRARDRRDWRGRSRDTRALRSRGDRGRRANRRRRRRARGTSGMRGPAPAAPGTHRRSRLRNSSWSGRSARGVRWW